MNKEMSKTALFEKPVAINVTTDTGWEHTRHAVRYARENVVGFTPDEDSNDRTATYEPVASPSRRRKTKRAAKVVAGLVAVAALAGCSSEGSGQPETTRTITVTETPTTSDTDGEDEHHHHHSRSHADHDKSSSESSSSEPTVTRTSEPEDETHRVTISASDQGLTDAISLHRGQRFRIEQRGSWTIGNDMSETGSGGYTDGQVDDRDENGQPCYQFEEFPYGSVVAVQGADHFQVENGHTYTAASDGDLSEQINEAPGCRSDNSGSINQEIILLN